MLPTAEPVAVGFAADRLERALSVFRSYAGRDPKRHAYPGAVLAVARRGQLAVLEAVGEASPAPEVEPVSVDHVFDVASLTKVVATAPAILLLLERGLLCLDDRVDAFLPEFEGRPFGAVTIRHLLTHTSGYGGQTFLWQLIPERGSAARALAFLTPDRLPGAQVEYSCAGYVLLGLIAELLTGEPLDHFVTREIFAPLGLNDTGFLSLAKPLPAHLAERLVPTEVRGESDKGRGVLRQVEEASGWPEEQLAAWRARHDTAGRPRGVVHDENAAFLCGVSGNAGLFSTARDLATYGQLWLSGGRLGDVRLIHPDTVRLATRNWTPGLAETRGLGWQLPGGDNSFGDLLARESFGHTGFTGTGLWIDPVHELVVVLLTNRLQLGRANERLFRIRKLILNSLVAALE